MKEEIYTTLEILERHGACKDRYDFLCRRLGPKWKHRDRIPLLVVQRLNGHLDLYWLLRVGATPARMRSRVKNILAAVNKKWKLRVNTTSDDVARYDSQWWRRNFKKEILKEQEVKP